MTALMAAAAESSDGGVNPLFFILGAVALIVVSTLGPLSRWSERRTELRRKEEGAPEKNAAHPDDPSV